MLLLTGIRSYKAAAAVVRQIIRKEQTLKLSYGLVQTSIVVVHLRFALVVELRLLKRRN